MKYSLLLSKRRPETSRYGKEVKMSQTATAGRVAGHFSAFALFHVCEGRYLCKIRSHSTKRSKSESRQERLNEQWIISVWQFVLETPWYMKLTSYQCFLTAAHRKWDVLLFCLNISRSMCWKKAVNLSISPWQCLQLMAIMTDVTRCQYAPTRKSGWLLCTLSLGTQSEAENRVTLPPTPSKNTAGES